MLRVATSHNKINVHNVALNIQSLGKSYNNVGLQLFSENSIHHVRKRASDETNDADLTNGSIINRQYGIPAELDINAVSLDINLLH